MPIRDRFWSAVQARADAMAARLRVLDAPPPPPLWPERSADLALEAAAGALLRWEHAMRALEAASTERTP